MILRKIINSVSRTFVLALQILLILSMGWISWKLLNETPAISPHAFPYLTSIASEIILDSQNEGKNLSKTGWADLLAVQSTLSKQDASPIVQQLKHGIAFGKINWKSAALSQQLIHDVKARRTLLIKYPLFEPQRYAFPVQGKPWYEDSWGADREGGIRKHEGTDLFAKEGTPLFSVSSGKIEKLGWNRLGGERVGIRGEDGNYYYYAHLKQIEPSLKIGQSILKGDPIGTMGHTGDALTTPDHLHFGIQIPDGTWINPYPFLAVWEHYPT
ncbi:M23 family metallopeptidase [Desulfitobacterium metallireducens]|uniref:Metalloendopeptidase n=1 Tax=Desulfitobacterium metallireducens DSM 15288 TaxID=871968 RepID=W0E7X4_9FIRM|nr:M23 family metallopeptidase [Desulfitobacterium metallireducens]AHF06965.1 metalloendopeptidase [Desulfitobacterium metallireducens DSM 15288]